MKLFLSMALFCLCGYAASAQSDLTVIGKVLSQADSTAVIGATVMGENGNPNTMATVDGTFRLKGFQPGQVKIVISFLGFRTKELQFEVKEAVTDIGEAYLEESENEIGAVMIVGEAPIAVQQADTTQFNASAFKANPDADADELLIKMPGIVIQDGKIEAQGEPVRRIYLDGKLFFGTDPMAALKNIPADAIESIQLFDDLSDQARFSGFEDEQTEKAINIITKNKNSENTIVKAEASGGSDIDSDREFRYLTGGSFSRFTEKQRITVTGLFNNVNTSKFGQEDLNNEQTDDNGNRLNQPTGKRKIAGLGASYSYEDERLKLSASYFYDHTRMRTERFSVLDYYPNPPFFDSKYQESYSGTDNTKNNHRVQLKLEWKINDRNQLIITPQVAFSRDDNFSRSMELNIQDGDSLNRQSGIDPNDISNFRIHGDALWTHRFKKKGRTISSNLYYDVNNRDNDRNKIFEYQDNYDPRLSQWRPANNSWDRDFDIHTSRNVLRLKVTWSEPLAPKHRLLVNAVGRREWGENNKQVVRYRTADDIYEKDPVQTSYFDRNYNSVGGGVGYSFANEKIRFNAGADLLDIMQHRSEYEPHVIDTDRDYLDFQPTASLRYSVDKGRYLRFRYNGRSVIPQIEYMQNVIDDSSPSNIRIGNPDLRQGYQHDVTLFYNAANTAKSTNFSLTLRARTVSNYVAQRTEYLDVDEGESVVINGQQYFPTASNPFLITYDNLDGYRSMNTEGTYSFGVRPIKSNMNVTVKYGYVRMPSFFNELNYANTHSTGLRVGLTSNISRNFDFNFYSDTGFNRILNTARDNSSYFNQNLYYSVNVIFGGGFVFNSLVSWKYYKTSGVSSVSNDFTLLDVSLGRKIFRERNGEIRITAYDVLSDNKNIQYFVRNNYIENVRADALGRYIMGRFIYRFNSMVHGGKKRSKTPAGDNFESIDVNQIRNLSKN